MIRHCDGIAVAPEARPATHVGVHDGGVRLRRGVLEPLEKRRPDVETRPLERVDHVEDLPLGVRNARGDDGTIAFVEDALVPVVERRRRRLAGDLTEPGILPGRLVEVGVDDHATAGPVAHGRLTGAPAVSADCTALTTFGKRSSRCARTPASRRAPASDSGVPSSSAATSRSACWQWNSKRCSA
jgi:hypothetical protein